MVYGRGIRMCWFGFSFGGLGSRAWALKLKGPQVLCSRSRGWGLDLGAWIPTVRLLPSNAHRSFETGTLFCAMDVPQNGAGLGTQELHIHEECTMLVLLQSFQSRFRELPVQVGSPVQPWDP